LGEGGGGEGGRGVSDGMTESQGRGADR